MPKRKRERNNDSKVVRAAPAPTQESEDGFQSLKMSRKRKRELGIKVVSSRECEFVEYDPDSDSSESAGDKPDAKKHTKKIESNRESSGNDDDSDFEDEDGTEDEADTEEGDYEDGSDFGDEMKSVEEEDHDMDIINEPPVKKPNFPELSANNLKGNKVDYREIRIPQHRYGMLKDRWMDIYNPIVKQLGLQVRFNVKTKNVEMRTCPATKDIGAIQKAEDFIKAFTYGFEIQDALAIVRLDDLYLERFKIQDVKTLKGDNLSRCIARVVGSQGKTKFTIENVTKTRIVINHDNISLLGTYHNLATARRAICSLIMGHSPGKVYSTMRAVAAKSSSRL